MAITMTSLRFALSLLCVAAACGGDDMPPVGPVETWMEFTTLDFAEAGVPIVAMANVPGRDLEMLITEVLGNVWHVRIEGDAVTVLGSFDLGLAEGCPALSMLFDPMWETNRFLYFGVCESTTGSKVIRVAWDGATYTDVAASAVDIFAVDEPRATRAWHQVGSMGFFEDQTMWILFGEQLRSDNAQNTASDLGKVIRIVPNRDPAGEGYTAPADNPFAGSATESPNVWAWGVRSPWRGVTDSRGRLWIGDVGEETWEEVDMVTEGGVNLGWPIHEGPCTGIDCGDFVQPIVSWNRRDDHPFVLEDELTEITTNRLAWVGLEYDPAGSDQYGGRLDGKMLYGDMCTGWVRGVAVDDAGTIVSDELMGHRAYIAQWVQASDGFLYVATLGACEDAATLVEAPTIQRVTVRSGS
jgi:hypothetical protein